MDFAKLKERILIQKCTTCTDEIGNHWNEWKAYFTCAAQASTYVPDEKEEAVETVERRTITFLIRYCREVERLKATKYRVIFRGDVYDIESVDPMNYDRKTMKLKCVLVPKRGDMNERTARIH